jgi:iron complex outermembrane recepter protein
MTRSRSNSSRLQGLQSAGARGRAVRQVPLASAISAILAAAPAVHAQQQAQGAAATGGLEEVIVTAQKVSENLQTVPISIQALGTEKLEQLSITNIDDYVKYLSGVTTVKSLGQGGTGIGTTHMYMRGVISGQDGNHSASQPSVGTYIDELPTTTIDGTIDVHIYDIARIEVLAGPQGTLYGASSEAGTIRIITNKPDATKFAAGYSIQGKSVDHGGKGWTGEGFVNIPLGPSAAIRLVVWDEHDPGYIHNVAGTNPNYGIIDGQRSFFTWTGSTGDTLSNAAYINSQYNTVSTLGGRAALKLDLGDNWTITPSWLGQQMSSNGSFGYDPTMGDLNVWKSGGEGDQDSFTQTGLTIEGKMNGYDLTVAGGWLTRSTHTISDYSDYSYWYDQIFASGCLWYTGAGYNYNQAYNAAHPGGPSAKDNCYNGNLAPKGSYAMPQEFVITQGHFTKWSTEVRLTTPQDQPVKGVIGAFVERQVHEIYEQYTIPGLNADGTTGNPYTLNSQGLAQALSIPSLNANSIWLTNEERVDRDKAIFGQATWDITPNWSVVGGIRFYRYENSLQGFYGFSANYQNLSGYYPGMNLCNVLTPWHQAPCQDLNQTVSDSGQTYRATINYTFNADALMYATYSTGYRPGGVNRVFDSAINAIFPPYQADYLHNYELGWKTQWDNHRVRWNGALFLEKWNNFQFLYLGPNSVTVVQNAASAEIRGVETELEWAPTAGWLFSGSLTYLHAVTTQNYCGPNAGVIPGTTQLPTDCPTLVNKYATGQTIIGPEAPSGTRLPMVPNWKGNLIARYTYPVSDWQGFIQGAIAGQTWTYPLLRLVDQENIGSLPGWLQGDLSAGFERNGLQIQMALTNVTDKRAELTRYVQCATTTCGKQPYVIPSEPRAFAIRLSQKF